MRDDGALPLVFYADLPGYNTPHRHLKGGISEFCLLFEPIHDRRMAVLLQDKETASLGGMFWFDKFLLNQTANISVWIRKPFRGAWAMEAAQLILDYAFNILKLHKLWALTPHRSAHAYALRAGFKSVVILEEYAMIDNELRQCYLSALTAQEFNGNKPSWVARVEAGVRLAA